MEGKMLGLTMQDRIKATEEMDLSLQDQEIVLIWGF